MKISQEQSPQQRQQLTQFQQQYFSLLALSSQELDRCLNSYYQENPLLELAPASHSPSYGTDPYSKDVLFRSIPAPPMHDRYAFFMEQLNLMEYSESELRLMCRMIDALDENGYFPLTVSEAAALYSVEEALIARCLSVLKALDPPGVFSQNMQECLITQLRRSGIQNEELEALIQNRFELFASSFRGKSGFFSGLDPKLVREYRRLISGLNPRPFYKPDCRNNHPIIPDIVCRYSDGEWEISLEEQNHYILNDYYLSMIEQCSEDERLYILKQRNEAEQLLSAVALRSRTLREIASLLISVQRDTLLYGTPPKTISMSQAAAQLNLAQSTISRACSGKYLSAPAGIFSLKDLFSLRAAASCNVSESEAKDLIKKLIAQEDPAAPLSDESIRSQLCSIGAPLSRRTVSKYRMLLGIPDSFHRKENRT